MDHQATLRPGCRDRCKNEEMQSINIGELQRHVFRNSFAHKSLTTALMRRNVMPCGGRLVPRGGLPPPSQTSSNINRFTSVCLNRVYHPYVHFERVPKRRNREGIPQRRES